MNSSKDIYYLTLTCGNQPGIVAAVAACLFKLGGDIREAQQFDDLSTTRFFMRVEFDLPAGSADQAAIRRAFVPVANQFQMTWELRDKSQTRRVIILVSKHDHCLSDLLYRRRSGELRMDIAGVVSNHPRASLNLDLLGDIPWHSLPVTTITKPEQEARIKTIVDEAGADLVILARYMQILSADLSAFLAGRCINIHHSFLPGFKGAKPYHQAFDRGVKVIGATAHFVTTDLDEGPIIVQETEPVTHADAPEDLVRKGRDIERRVLARAVHYYLEDRVLVNGLKTVVFRD